MVDKLISRIKVGDIIKGYFAVTFREPRLWRLERVRNDELVDRWITRN